MAYALEVNGRTVSVDVDADTPLLWVLRDNLQLNGTKYGCGIGACGACSVHVDGNVVRSCSFPVSAAAGRAITTIEALSPDRSHAVQQAWDLEPELAQLLGFAAQLHELGTAVNARHYHRHGGYVVKHADLAGFGADEQGVLALLIRGHRRSLPVLAFSAYDPEQGTRLLKLVALLRIAVILERSHSDAHSPVVGCTANATTLRLQLGDAWLQAHPLSARELEVEVGQLAGAGLTLTFG